MTDINDGFAARDVDEVRAALDNVDLSAQRMSKTLTRAFASRAKWMLIRPSRPNRIAVQPITCRPAGPFRSGWRSVRHAIKASSTGAR